ncbi:MAG: sialidase family protein [Actinomycetota bacterium]
MRCIIAVFAVGMLLLPVGAWSSDKDERVPTDVIVHGPGAKKPTTVHARATASRTGATAFEPTLGIISDGTILFQGAHYPDNDPSGPFGTIVPDVLRSEDRGKTWEYASPTVGDQHTHRSTNDPFLYIDDETDRVFTVDWIQASYCSQLSHSDDAGETWTMTRLGCGGSDHQHVFAGPPAFSATVAYPNVVYICAQSIPSAICSKSLDGGMTFRNTGAPPFLEVSDVLDCGRLTGHGDAASDGTVYLPTACDKPYLAISRDEGATWQVVTVADASTNSHHEAAMAVDANGTVYYLWMKADRLPYLAISNDGGRTFPRVVPIAPPGVKEASLPALAVNDTGIVAAAYMGSTDSPGVDGDHSRTTWSAYITLTRNASAARPIFYSARFGSRRDPFVVGECGPRRCQAAYDFIDVQLQGRSAWASFVDGCDGLRCIDIGSEFGEGVVAGLHL